MDGDVRKWHAYTDDGIMSVHFYSYSWEDAMKTADSWAVIKRAAAKRSWENSR